MANDTTQFQVVHDADNSAFILRAANKGTVIGRLDYVGGNREIDVVHTEVDQEWNGRGLGGRLMSAAAEFAVGSGMTLVPSCSFAVHWLRQNPDVAAQVAQGNGA